MEGKIGIILNDSLLTSCRWTLFQQRWDLVRGLHLVDAPIRVVVEWKKEDVDVENLLTAATDHAFKGNDATNTVVQVSVHFSPTPNHLTGKILQPVTFILKEDTPWIGRVVSFNWRWTGMAGLSGEVILAVCDPS